ncbi:M20/M25/M40 family metallo-hydrolase, partial [Candidatus Sumerlaeota bacterium]|nr:M20/M25/M40 family metallo-hydrolase [Candidatus Sumerlaeota bacterium]
MMKRILKLAAIPFGALLLTLVIVLLRAAGFSSKQISVKPVPKIEIDEKGAVERLAAAVRIKTVSHQDPKEFDPQPFRDLDEHIKRSFPKVHEKLARETISGYSFLYTWKGTDPALKPVLLMGHMDVVPVEPGTEEKWEHPPFSGELAGGFIWGRGSLDDKLSVFAALEAAEKLIGEGFQPARTIYFAFGHNEEVGGTGGASEIAALLKSRGIELHYVMDEGLAITDGMVPGVASPVALIGIAEKGYMSIEL